MAQQSVRRDRGRPARRPEPVSVQSIKRTYRNVSYTSHNSLSMDPQSRLRYRNTVPPDTYRRWCEDHKENYKQRCSRWFAVLFRAQRHFFLKTIIPKLKACQSCVVSAYSSPDSCYILLSLLISAVVIGVIGVSLSTNDDTINTALFRNKSNDNSSLGDFSDWQSDEFSIPSSPIPSPRVEISELGEITDLIFISQPTPINDDSSTPNNGWDEQSSLEIDWNRVRPGMNVIVEERDSSTWMGTIITTEPHNYRIKISKNDCWILCQTWIIMDSRLVSFQKAPISDTSFDALPTITELPTSVESNTELVELLRSQQSEFQSWRSEMESRFVNNLSQVSNIAAQTISKVASIESNLESKISDIFQSTAAASHPTPDMESMKDMFSNNQNALELMQQTIESLVSRVEAGATSQIDISGLQSQIIDQIDNKFDELSRSTIATLSNEISAHDTIIESLSSQIDNLQSSVSQLSDSNSGVYSQLYNDLHSQLQSEMSTEILSHQSTIPKPPPMNTQSQTTDYSDGQDWIHKIAFHSTLAARNTMDRMCNYLRSDWLHSYDQSAILPTFKPGDCTALNQPKYSDDIDIDSDDINVENYYGASKIIVKLYQNIRVDRVGMYHLHTPLNPTWKARKSAPKQFSIKGYVRKYNRWDALGEFEYDFDGEPMQYFPVSYDNIDFDSDSDSNNSSGIYDMIGFKFISNGGADYTCVYRLRVFGAPVYE